MALLKVRARAEGEAGPQARGAHLSVADEKHLARRWRILEDREALARLVEAHLGLVIRIAQDFRNAGPAMEDLIQEGNLGLVIAARRFDPGQNTRLSTYATYWIRACMMEHVVRSHGPVRIGTTRSQRKIFFGLGRARRQVESEGRVADPESLAKVLGVEPTEIDAMTPRLAARDVWLDAPRSSDDARHEGHMLSGDGPNPEDIVGTVEQEDQHQTLLRRAVKVLDTRERAIIRARHMCQRPSTLGALGKKFGVSRERVRQIELRAMNKLKAFCRENEESGAGLAGLMGG